MEKTIIPNYLDQEKASKLLKVALSANIPLPDIEFERRILIGVTMIPLPNVAELVRLIPPENINGWMFMVGDVPSELCKVLTRLIKLNPERVREHWGNI